MNPVLPFFILIPLLLIVVSGGVWLSWKSTATTSGSVRKVLLSLRLLALVALALILLNPGKWISLTDRTQRPWVTLIDDSQSMSVEAGERSRAAEASQLLEALDEHHQKEDLTTETFTFGDQLEERKEGTDLELKASGQHSDLSKAADSLLSQLSARGETPAGLVILSDGRQTHQPRQSDVSLRARALGVPFFTVPIGSQYQAPDLALTLPRKTVTVFPGQNAQITVGVSSKNLGSFESQLDLLDEKMTLLKKETVRVGQDEQVWVTFSLPAPEQSTTWTVSIPTQDGEFRTSNNSAQVHLRVLKNKARVFIAEGAPYWDSKFLAQLLRQQEYMDVHSVHRLSDTRYFRIDSGESKPAQSETDFFPSSLEALQSYDLIIFGKNAEHFITAERAELLRRFVRDQGGAVLFARAKPYSGRLPALEPLEPVAWATGTSDEFSLRPSLDGQAAGLFGQALPAPESEVWETLPKLKDGHRVDIVKPFTRVLAHGRLATSSVNDQFPLLLVRRYGQGVTSLVNADGLWKWDFYPKARELGNMYHEFWIQLIYWMLSYSEFLPGQDYSLNLSALTVDPGTPVAVKIAYRGKDSSSAPQLEIIGPDSSEPLLLSPAQQAGKDGRLTWAASFSPEQVGNYQVRLRLPGMNKEALPAANLTVSAPLAEMDELSPDHDFLKRFAESTGGKMIPVAEFQNFLKESVTERSPATLDQGMIWKPFWLHFILPFLLTAFLTSEWFLRRRNGLL